MTKHLSCSTLSLALCIPTLVAVVAVAVVAPGARAEEPVWTTTASEPRTPRVFEISATAETTWLVADSAAVTSAAASAATPGVRVGWSPLDALDVYVGWRALGELHRDDMAWDMRTDGNAIVAGARGRYRLLPWLALVGELDLEAMLVDVEVSIGARRGSTSDWTFGAVPRVGIEASVDLDVLEAVLRLEGGYAFRMQLAADDVVLSSEASSVVPVDLGTLDLSGPVLALTLGLRF